MKNIGNIIKSLQNTLRKDPGVSGDAQRIEQLGWLIFLKILDDKDQELELLDDDYRSPLQISLRYLFNNHSHGIDHRPIPAQGNLLVQGSLHRRNRPQLGFIQLHTQARGFGQ